MDNIKRNRRIAFRKLAYDNYIKNIKPNIKELEEYRKKECLIFHLISLFWFYIPSGIYTILFIYYIATLIIGTYFEKDIVLIPWLIAIGLNLFPLHLLIRFKKPAILLYIPYGICLILFLHNVYIDISGIFTQQGYNNFLNSFMLTFILANTIVPIFYFLSKNHYNSKFNEEVKNSEFGKKLISDLDIEWFMYKNKQSVSVINDETLQRSDLFPFYNQRILCDEFKGTYKNIPFKISETKMISGYGRNRYFSFNGVVIEINYDKRIDKKVVIAPKTINDKLQSIFALLGIVVIISEMFIDGYSHIKLILAIIFIIVYFVITIAGTKQLKEIKKIQEETEEFYNNFIKKEEHYNGKKSYYVTNSLMYHLNELKTAFKSKNMKCSFFEDTIIIAITTNRNLFEPVNLFKPLDKFSTFAQFYDELYAIYKLINHIK